MRMVEPYRKNAISFMAAYDTKEAGAYEKDIVRLAHKWLRILTSKHSTQGQVDKLLECFETEPPADYGCAWHDLHLAIETWARTEGWLDE